ncbi:MAG: hypothetical protein NTY89_15850 [Nostocales cyanobacterium LacPavin_0920_SED1_MAG_38_18]|nr:hypothetical protein [Nostocales cyanobacterium LacPavin_0920_SED1_MAG_38_18]
MENQNQLSLILQGIQDLQQKTSGFYNVEQRVYRLEESFSLLTTQIKVLETHQDSDKENWNKLDLHKDRIRKAEEFIGLIEKIPGGLTSILVGLIIFQFMIAVTSDVLVRSLGFKEVIEIVRPN